MKYKSVLVACSVTAVLALVLMGLLSVGVQQTTSELALANTEDTAEAILTNASIDDATVISVPVMYYDQEMDTCVDMYNVSQTKALESRQFEWSKCGYYVQELETGLVEYELNDEYLPISVSGEALPNRKLDFGRWFAEVDGVSKFFAGTLDLGYNKETTSFEFGSDGFYPLNQVMVGDTKGVNGDGDNHLFTMSMGVPFRVLKSGKEEFEITADDDTWVFINDRLALDMGGIHDATVAILRINEAGEIYTSVEGVDFAYTGIKLDGDSAVLRIFHADRDSYNSVFRVKFSNMVLNINNTNIAKRDGGVELAYDPTDPSYVAPLGESVMVKPNSRHLLAVKMMVQIVAIGGAGVVVVVAISLGWKYWRRGRSREG